MAISSSRPSNHVVAALMLATTIAAGFFFAPALTIPANLMDATVPNATVPNATVPNATVPAAAMVDLTAVIDRSGSMQSMHGAHIPAVRAFIEEQHGAAVEAGRLDQTQLRLVSFDSVAEVVFEGKLADAFVATNRRSVLDDALQPRGATRLLDTAAEELLAQKARVEAAVVEPTDAYDAAQHRPAAVQLFALLTDGQDNQSQEHTKKSFEALITQARTRGVLCVFLAANMDAVEEGGTMGFERTNSLTFDNDGSSIASSMRTFGAKSARTMQRRAALLEEAAEIEAQMARLQAAAVSDAVEAADEVADEVPSDEWDEYVERKQMEKEQRQRRHEAAQAIESELAHEMTSFAFTDAERAAAAPSQARKQEY